MVCHWSCQADTHTSLSLSSQAALDIAIEPTVQQCVEDFQARQQSYAIVQLRRRAERLAETPEEVKWINRQLHKPTMDLRKGLYVNEHDVIVTLESELQDFRQQQGATCHESA